VTRKRKRAPSDRPTLLSNQDLYLFNEGTHLRLYDKLGAHPGTWEGEPGTHFAVWAPNARRVSVVGDFNGWDPLGDPLEPRASSGIWEGFVPGAEPGAHYKYHVVSHVGGHMADKADPFAFYAECPPRTASTIWNLDYRWADKAWMDSRRERIALDAPVAIYEIHLGSWRRERGGRALGYREAAPLLADYVCSMGFTHVEFLPVMEHPFYGSWGYQTTGYFAPTSRYGSPQDFMFLIDTLHQRGIGVILDWVPSHFPTDGHGLGFFDGTHLYEHGDSRLGFHPDWASFIFNYGRHEVRSFLLSSALHWLDRYHVDGLRVDAVASMLYLDYSRPEGEWIPNEHGGRENLAAIDFIRQLNSEIYQNHPDVQTFAEESTAWPMVSRPTYLGGLGFGLKWDMGWMHDTLEDITREPIHRKFHHNRGTTGRSSRTCACSSATCTRSRARSCSSWEVSSASGTSGCTRTRSTGICSTTSDIAAYSAGYAISTPSTAPSRPSTNSTARLAGSRGSTATTRPIAPCSTCGTAGAPRTFCWWPATSRRCRATTIRSAFRSPGAGRRSSTAMRPSTAAADRATSARRGPQRPPLTVTRNPSR
jgi:1,4-alpha-glucan branching enzyme